MAPATVALSTLLQGRVSPDGAALDPWRSRARGALSTCGPEAADKAATAPPLLTL
ncbi:hypothetical protein OG906_40530 (plasmid) [Streptomyces sp. NBC_01426]|uniref:hypothetical protein n=1 Tax=Streptomyces sp. NBC_01426 TaxID=2975866 RepID=UPI002E350CC4|nr:hypothetical protein [Streptomyces sp. NBC_01426]